MSLRAKVSTTRLSHIRHTPSDITVRFDVHHLLVACHRLVQGFTARRVKFCLAGLPLWMLTRVGQFCTRQIKVPNHTLSERWHRTMHGRPRDFYLFIYCFMCL